MEKKHRTKGEMILERLQKIYDSGNYLRLPHFRIVRYKDNQGKLPYPTHEVVVGEDKCLVYDIPRNMMQKALDKANAFKGLRIYPANKKRRVPLTDGKYYYFHQAIIIYFKRHNYILPPMFFETGETGGGWCIFTF